MGLQFNDTAGNTGLIQLAVQLTDRTVNGADRLFTIHLAELHDHLGAGNIEQGSTPGIVYQQRIVQYAEVVGDDAVDLRGAHLDFQRLRQDELVVVGGFICINFTLVKVNTVGVTKENSQFFVVQTMGCHFALHQGGHGHGNLVFQLPLVTVKQNQIEMRHQYLFFQVQGAQFVDAVVDDLNTGLQLFLGEDASLIASFQRVDLIIFTLNVFIQHHGPLNLHQIGSIFGANIADHAAQRPVNGVGAAVGTEEAELHSGDLDGSTEIVVAVVDEAAADLRDFGHLLDVLTVQLLLRYLGFVITLFSFSFSALPDRSFFLFGDFFVLEQLVLGFAGLFFRLFSTLFCLGGQTALFGGHGDPFVQTAGGRGIGDILQQNRLQIQHVICAFFGGRGFFCGSRLGSVRRGRGALLALFGLLVLFGTLLLLLLFLLFGPLAVSLGFFAVLLAGYRGSVQLLVSAFVRKVAQQLQQEHIVGLFVNAHQQQCEYEEEHQFDPKLPRQGRDEHEEHNEDPEKAHQNIRQRHAAEEFC